MRYRLRQRAAFWRSFCRSSVVLDWVLHGLPLRWGPKGRPTRPYFGKNHKSALEHQQFTDEQVAKLVQTSTVQEVAERPFFVSPLGVVVQASGKKRLILDLQALNEHVFAPHFKYETLAELPEVLQPGDFMFTADLKSGYHHVDMREECWTYLGFEWRGRYYVFTQLPFGLNVACWAFTKLTRELLGKWRREGHRCSGYIDDSIHAHQSAAELKRWQARVLRDLAAAGFLVSAEKCALEPARQQVYLGMLVDTAAGRYIVPQHKRERLLGSIAAMLRARKAQLRAVQSVAGQINAMGWAFGPLARMYTQALNRVGSTPLAPEDYVRLGAGALEELEFWRGSFDRFNGTWPLWRPTQVHSLIRTDASGPDGRYSYGGWGAWTESHEAGFLQAAGRFTPSESAGASSTLLELKAVLLALQSFNTTARLAGSVVKVLADNQPACHIITRGGSPVPEINEVSKALFWFCVEHSITLVAEWVPRERNTLADALSKQLDTDDWQLNPREFRRLCAAYGPYDTDLFASHTNHLVARYYTRYYTPGTAGVDAFRFRWRGNSWCNPPFSLIGRVWRHAEACRARLTLIAPYWVSKSWWHRLVAGSTTHFAPAVQAVEVLPGARDLFLPGSSGNSIAIKAPLWQVLALALDFSRPRSQQDRVEIPSSLRWH